MTTAQRATFTDRYLKSLKPAEPGKRNTHWDAAKPSFGARVTDRGVVSFFVMRRLKGKPQPVRVALGRYPEVSLSEARKAAANALGDLVAGVHPKRAREEQARQQRLAEAKQRASKFAGLADLYLRRKRRTSKEIARVIRRNLLPRWGDRAVTDIRRSDVTAMVEGVAERGASAGRQALAYASAIFAYGAAIEYGGLEVNPCSLVKASKLLGKAEARQRVLTDPEIAAVWNATSDYPAGTFIRLLILTAARRRQVSDMTWAELDLDAGLWTLPGIRTKNGKPDEQPLSQMAVDILRSTPRFAGPYVLSFKNGHNGIRNYGEAKTRIDARAPGIVDWRLHDLRRTTRTGMSALGVTPFIAELILGHQQKGVHAIYDLHRYRAEKREALERWAAKVRSIVEPPPANVVNLAQRGG
jgi:integrase